MSDLSRIFALDPNKCTRTDIAQIVQAFRDRRAQFELGNMKAGSTKPVTGKMAELMKSVKSDDIDL